MKKNGFSNLTTIGIQCFQQIISQKSSLNSRSELDPYPILNGERTQVDSAPVHFPKPQITFIVHVVNVQILSFEVLCLNYDTQIFLLNFYCSSLIMTTHVRPGSACFVVTLNKIHRIMSKSGSGDLFFPKVLFSQAML